jgi:hypothetical protein
MKEDELLELEPYLRDIQSMVPANRNVTEKAERRQRMVRLLRERLEAARHRGASAARA